MPSKLQLSRVLALANCVLNVAAFSKGERPDNKTSVKMYEKGMLKKVVADNLDEFEIMKNYMFITQTVSRFLVL